MIALLGGRLYDPAGGWDGAPADIYVDSGLIRSVRQAGTPPPEGNWETTDCAGLAVLPGPIDTLCHLELGRDPWREDLRRLASAAAAAGWTALLVYTGTADPDVVAALAAQDVAVRLYPVAAATVGGHLAEMATLADAGAVAFSDAPEPLGDAGLMRRVLEYAGAVGLPVVAWPRDQALARGGVMHEGALSFALGLRGIPAAAEVAAVGRDVDLRRAFGGRLHFAALSAAASLDRLESGVTAGVTAHHLSLTEDAVRGYDTAAKLDPPLRAAADREALVAAARAGRLVMASGHRPQPPECKACEYDYAAVGAPAVATALPAGLAALGPQGLARAVAAAPAAAFGLAGGAVRPGAPADLVVLDPAARFVVPGEGEPGGAGPLAGRELTGRAVLTLVGGRAAFVAEGHRIKMQKLLR